MKKYVVDANTAVKWFIPEVHSAAASRLVDPAIALFAPDLFAAEIGNILWKKIRRREITEDDAMDILAALGTLAVELTSSAQLLAAALELALVLDHPVYDCLYLALAISLNCPVVTADRRFQSAVTRTTFAPHLRWVEDEL